MRHHMKTVLAHFDPRSTVKDFILLTTGALILAANVNIFLAVPGIDIYDR